VEGIDMNSGPEPTPAAARRTTAIAGLLTILLAFGGQALIQVGGGEPPFDARAEDVAAFFATRDSVLFPIGAYLSVLGVVTMLWFLGGLYTLTRPGLPAVIALISGVVFVAVVSTGGWELGTFRQAEGIDPQIARLTFDMGNLGFANGWVALGSLAVAAGCALLSTRVSRPWLGWLAIAAGVCLIPARAFWTTQFYLVGYGLFWLWVIALCVVLLRKPDT
jgi:hypothetical protein